MTDNILQNAIELILPYVIAALEFMGIFVVSWSGIKSFFGYIQNSFFGKKLDIKFDLANGLATALEFKMAAEILKTVLIREMSELLILGAVILLRAILSVLIHFEINSHKKESHNQT
jgi:uncharacterized membrane protein